MIISERQVTLMKNMEQRKKRLPFGKSVGNLRSKSFLITINMTVVLEGDKLKRDLAKITVI